MTMSNQTSHNATKKNITPRTGRKAVTSMKDTTNTIITKEKYKVNTLKKGADTTDTTDNRFNTLIEEYERAYLQGEYVEQLNTLATVIAYSVLKKLYDPNAKKGTNSGCNPIMKQLSVGITVDKAIAEVIAIANNAADTDGKGAPVPDAVLRSVLSDGIELVSVATEAILTQTFKYCPGSTGWMTTSQTEKRLSKRVYIRLEDSAAYADTEIIPIQECFRAVRRAVAQSATVKADKSKYTYIADMIGGVEGLPLETVYYRLGKYADLGGYEADLYGRSTTRYTVDRRTAEDTQELLTALDLTPSQKQTISLRLQGYGYKAIATYFGVTPEAIRNRLKKIQVKACKYWGNDIISEKK